MVITKTPFRISFFGGGTDYPAWFRKHGGSVLGTTIDKYAYISCRYLPPFHDHKYRIVYSKMENRSQVSDIQHPSVRECIKHLEIIAGLEIHHDSDLPAKSGLGSSSTFTVGLLNCLYSLRGKHISREELAKKAIYIEQVRIEENVGNQDQIHAAYGGFNQIEFVESGDFKVNPVILKPEALSKLENYLLLFYTGISRYASDVASEQIKKTSEREKELFEMQSMVPKALGILNDRKENLDDFGRLLHESWKLKRSLTDKISTLAIDDIYEKAISAGALGGKLLGAGGGGFLLFYCNPENHEKVIDVLRPLLHVPFRFEKNGTHVIFCEPDNSYEL